MILGSLEKDSRLKGRELVRDDKGSKGYNSRDWYVRRS